MTKTLIDQFKNLRRVGTPIAVIKTVDPSAVAAAITAAYPSEPVIQWDAAAGFTDRGAKGAAVLKKLGVTTDNRIVNSADAMAKLTDTTEGTIVFVYNAHKLWAGASEVQGMWNVRDLYRGSRRTLVLLATPEVKVPRELESDSITLDDPLPTEEQLRAVVVEICQNSMPPLPVPDDKTMARITDALKGLSLFVAEQITALALTRSGVNVSELWDRKRQAVEQTNGAKIYRGGVKFANVGGHDGLKRELGREIRSKRPVKLVVVFDEFEKMMAGASSTHVGDGGVAKDKAQVTLTFMQDHNVRGAILFGHPGAGKTLIAKAMANEAGCLCILADMGAMSAGIVGESEANVRAFFNLILAIAGEGGAFFVATCNTTGALTTELRRRFKTGFYFIDLPTREEKDAIWAIKMAEFGIKKQQMPDDTDWTGAEIEVCCEKADNYGLPLVEVAKSIVTVASSQPELIRGRREEAAGRLLSSATGQTYQLHEAAETVRTVNVPRSVALMQES